MVWQRMQIKLIPKQDLGYGLYEQRVHKSQYDYNLYMAQNPYLIEERVNVQGRFHVLHGLPWFP